MSATAMVELRPGTTGGRLAVGVAELTGLAPIRRFLDIPHLERMHAAFEAVCRRALSRRDGAFVPHHDGESVVYVAPSVDDAIAIAQELIARDQYNSGLLPVRVGVASGTVLLTQGRCYGPAVDLATLRMAAAPPGTVSAT